MQLWTTVRGVGQVMYLGRRNKSALGRVTKMNSKRKKEALLLSIPEAAERLGLT